jgi:hypothetical protein
MIGLFNIFEDWGNFMTSELDKFLREQRQFKEEGREFHGMNFRALFWAAAILAVVVFLL